MTLVVGLLGMLASACVFPQSTGVDAMLAESPRGAVFLQKAEDGWFRTAHPLDLSPDVLATVFRGVRVQTSPDDRVTGDRVFSDEDTEFLSPLMSAALSKATKGQVVGFRVVHRTDVGEETTGGILYVQGRLLHLTFTHYRARLDHSEQSDPSHRMNPDPIGLHNGQIEFSPDAASRSNRNEQPDVTDAIPLASLVLDYETLIAASDRRSTPVQPQSLRPDKASVVQQSGKRVEAPVMGKEQELDALKEEMRTLQRRLSELDAEVQKTKKP